MNVNEIKTMINDLTTTYKMYAKNDPLCEFTNGKIEILEYILYRMG